MLTGVMSTKNGRYGIVDEETGKIVIPLIYKSVSVQKYGIVAECDNSMHSDIFSLSAKKISTTYKKKNLIIEIEDTGIGIKDVDKIFLAGYTTKGVGVGTGLGLAICSKIIAKHNGKIDVKSEINKGSKFTITIPGE